MCGCARSAFRVRTSRICSRRRQANRLVVERRIDPCMSEVFAWNDIPKAHTKMWKNEHLPGNMAVLVNAQRTGLRTFEDVVEAGKR